MSLEKWLRSVNCPTNLKAEHYWVRVHVVEILAFLYIQYKDETFANHFHHFVAVRSYVISPTLQLFPLASLSLRGGLTCKTVQWAVKSKEQREHRFCLHSRGDRNMVWWTDQSHWGRGSMGRDSVKVDPSYSLWHRTPKTLYKKKFKKKSV